MPTLYVDDQPYSFEGSGRNLLEVCLSLGLDIPYFCWHPALHSVGACRICAVKQYKDESDTEGKLVMACMMPALDGTRISIEDPQARAFRASVSEWLMAGHPHDCPVCDEGGECHLQDMTVMTGHVRRRARFPKRTHRNQYLGPFVAHEMNRCIQCYRCVRFYQDIAGGRDLDVFGWHDEVYFGRFQEGALESPFSGNLVEVCPTGVFTDATLKRHYTRKWDLQTAPSVCVHCSLGCNTIAGERYGLLRRILTRYNSEVNGYFLCDRGRFGYEFVNSAQRVRQALFREASGARRAVGRAEALERAAGMLGRGTVLGIGSPRASVETNFALRALVGPDRFFAGMSPREFELCRTMVAMLASGPAPATSLRDLSLADAVLVLGEDVGNTAPLLALAIRRSALQAELSLTRALGVHDYEDAIVREALQQERGPVLVVTTTPTLLDQEARLVRRLPPGEIAGLGRAIAHEIAPGPSGAPDLPPELRELAGTIARTLMEAGRPVVVSGYGLNSMGVVSAAANVAWALCAAGRPAGLCLTFPECNSHGLCMMASQGLDAALERLRADRHATLLIAENDLYRRLRPALADELLDSAERVIVLDHLQNATADRAHLLLPAATFAEATGSLVNNEGRGQRFHRAFLPEGGIVESWRWLGDMAQAAGLPGAGPWPGLDALLEAVAGELPLLAPLKDAAPPASFRAVGQRIPRQPRRTSGRTAMTAHRDVHEQRPPEDPDSPLAYSMEGYGNLPPPALVPRFWAAGWNSVQSVTRFQREVAGPLSGGDPGCLLATAGSAESLPPADVPATSPIPEGSFLAVPAHHVFGSEELSAHAPGIRELTPAPHVDVNPADAQQVGLVEGQSVAVSDDEATHWLALHLEPSLPRGVVALPVGLVGYQGVELPARVTLSATGPRSRQGGEIT